MRVLILSCNTGEGHNAAGRAIEERVKYEGHEAVMIDIMMLAGKRTSKIVGNTYINVAKHTPRLFHLAYRAGMAISSAKHKSPVYYANALMAKHLKNYLLEHPCDVIVTPHLYPAETITYMKRKGMNPPKTVVVTTDYTCIPFWEETECDYYILPHKDLIEEYVTRGLDREKLLPYGIPVKMDFARKIDKTRAKIKCKLPTDTDTYLIMSGSMGFGKLQLFAYELVKECDNGEHIVIICGNNKKLRRILKHEFKGNERVHIIGFTEHVSEYMDACDVIFTKPGGLTSTEAAVKNIPMVHTAPIPGCETSNLEFFAERGMSVCAKKIKTQIREGKMLVKEKEVRKGMLYAQRKNSNPNASCDIVNLLLSICGDEDTCDTSGLHC